MLPLSGGMELGGSGELELPCLQVDGTYPRHVSGGSIHNGQLKISIETLTRNNLINWDFLFKPFSASLAANAL